MTDSIHGASVLKASKFRPLAFTGRAFILEATKDNVHALTLLQTAASPWGATPVQWMAKVLHNYSQMVGFAKRSNTIISERFDDQTLLLTADSDRKTRDRFHGLVA